jgi:hypothetical protein
MKISKLLLPILPFLFIAASTQAQTLPGKFWSSWIGNTFGGKNSSFGSPNPSDASDKWVQDYIDCMTVTDDGTCYTTSEWDEAGRTMGIYKNGDVLGHGPGVGDCKIAGGFSIVGTNITGNGKTISNAGTPTAIAMGKGIYEGKLLVADNGQRKQILIYDVSATPVIVETIGALGGIAADFTPMYEFPAAINAPAYPVKSYPQGFYHPYKLWGMTGVGCDLQGRIFVSTSEMGSAIRCFKKVSGNWILDWRVENYFFVDNIYYDDKTDAAEVYGVQEHFRLDFSQKAAGKEWSIIGYTLDSYTYPEDARGIEAVKASGEHGLTSVVFREINGTRYLFTQGMTCQPPQIFKFKPGTDIAVPCAMFMGRDATIYGEAPNYWWPPQRPTKQPGTMFWSDLNNDAKYQSNEYSFLTNNFSSGDFYVDKSGNIWKGGNPIVKWKPTFNANGNITYSDANTEKIQISGVAAIGKIIFQDDKDRLVLLSMACRNITGGKMYIVDNWSTGNRNARYVGDIKGPNQSAWTVAGDYAFEAGWETRAKVWVTDLNNGKTVGTMIPDASTGGLDRTGWVDISSGIQAYQRTSTGEYLVFVEDDFLSRVILYRWCLTGDCMESDMKVNLTTPEKDKVYLNYNPLTFAADLTKDTSVVSKVEFQINDTIVGQSVTAPYQFLWNQPTPGLKKAYAKATSTTGKTAFSPLITFKISDGTPDIQFFLNKRNYSVADAVSLTATATDYDGTIASVTFYNGNTALFTDNSAPYSYNWTGIPRGTINLRVKAVDNAGKIGWSEIIPIKVSEIVTVDNLDPGWTWSGFTLDPCGVCFNGNTNATDLPDQYAIYTFIGSYLEVYAEVFYGGGDMEIFIDGVSKGIFSQNNSVTASGIFATISGLTNEQHVAKFVSRSNGWVSIDYIRYAPNPPAVGSLSGNFAFNYTAVDLSVGTADWKHFANNDHKAVGYKTNSISDYSVVNAPSAPYSDDQRPASWTGGTPTETSSANLTGQRTTGIGNGFSFDVKAGNDLDTLKIYVSGNAAGGTLKAHLSNESALDYEQAVATSRTNKWAGIFAIIYNANEANQTLTVTWIQSAGTGTFHLQAASVLGNTDINSGLEGTIKKSPAIQVYPNPYKDGELTVKINVQGNQVITIVDITGKIVYKTQTNTSTVKIPDLSLNKGIYIVNVRGDNLVGNAKLIIK